MQAASPLTRDYYLVNFKQVLATVSAQYHSILPPAELMLLQHFTRLTGPAQMLLVRLLGRKGDYFRVGKLSYKEIQNLDAAVAELALAGLVEESDYLPITECLALFSKSEWLAKIEQGHIRVAHNAPKTLSRRELDQQLLAALDGASAAQLTKALSCRFVRLRVQKAFDGFRLLYFGNLHQDLSEFVLRDLQLQRYEAYPLSARTRLFDSWAEVSAYLQVHECLQALARAKQCSLEQLLAISEQIPTVSTKNSKLIRRIDDAWLVLARELERRQAYKRAEAIYVQLQTHPARERLARVLVQLNQPKKALSLCQQILAEPWCDDEQEFAATFGHRTAAKSPLGYWPKPKSYVPPSEHWRLPHPGVHNWGERHPEYAVALALEASGRVYYVENQLFLAVFALVYWPVIFTPARGAFSHPFQSKPHDLYWPSFLKRRQAACGAIDQWLDACVNSPSNRLALQPMLQCYQQKKGINCSLVAWAGLTEELLRQALESIPADHWRAIFRYLWQDLSNRRRGLPDLIFFPRSGGYQLIEVKGPGDKLQTHQRRWLHQFEQIGVPHKVVSLDWQ